jgi:pimeloyl-ACP methyl ester carboxylesterase
MIRSLLVLFAASLALFFVLLTPTTAVARNAILNVNGQNFYVETVGVSGPPIVFEAGLGNEISTWRLVSGPVSAFAKPVLYDRAGLGQSLPMMTKGAVTADEVVTNLHALLATADIRPPYILVGHSLGGLYVQLYARKYPMEVSGMVLLDSSSVDAPPELKTRARLEPGSAALLEEEGVTESNEQVRNAGPFPDIPLTVIAATDHGPFFKDWERTLIRLQHQLAKLSLRSRFVIAQGSGHDIQLKHPEIVIDALKQMVAEIALYRP